MKKILLHIINIGIDENIPTDEVKYIKTVNVSSIVLSIFTLSFLPSLSLFLPYSFPIMMANAIQAVFLLIPLLFQQKKQFYYARLFLCIFTGSLFETIKSLLLGLDAQVHYYLALFIILPPFFFPRKEQKSAYFFMFYYFVLFIFVLIYLSINGPILERNPEFIRLYSNVIIVGAPVFMLIFSIYSSNILWNAEQQVYMEKEKSENLLHNILPVKIAARLKGDTKTIADGFANVSVLFADIVGFTTLSNKLPPENLVEMLNTIFSKFDDLVVKYGLEKIKTIGDAYMVAAGIPENREDHAEAIADFALDMQKVISEFKMESGEAIRLRIGINSGPVVAGVIGKKKFIYDLWGDSVNTASRMESHSIAGEIQITHKTYELLKDKYNFRKRGMINVKGKGELETFILIGKKF